MEKMEKNDIMGERALWPFDTLTDHNIKYFKDLEAQCCSNADLLNMGPLMMVHRSIKNLAALTQIYDTFHRFLKSAMEKESEPLKTAFEYFWLEQYDNYLQEQFKFYLKDEAASIKDLILPAILSTECKTQGDRERIKKVLQVVKLQRANWASQIKYQSQYSLETNDFDYLRSTDTAAFLHVELLDNYPEFLQTTLLRKLLSAQFKIRIDNVELLVECLGNYGPEWKILISIIEIINEESYSECFLPLAKLLLESPISAQLLEFLKNPSAENALKVESENLESVQLADFEQFISVPDLLVSNKFSDVRYELTYFLKAEHFKRRALKLLLNVKGLPDLSNRGLCFADFLPFLDESNYTASDDEVIENLRLYREAHAETSEGVKFGWFTKVPETYKFHSSTFEYAPGLAVLHYEYSKQLNPKVPGSLAQVYRSLDLGPQKNEFAQRISDYERFLHEMRAIDPSREKCNPLYFSRLPQLERKTTRQLDATIPDTIAYKRELEFQKLGITNSEELFGKLSFDSYLLAYKLDIHLRAIREIKEYDEYFNIDRSRMQPSPDYRDAEKMFSEHVKAKRIHVTIIEPIVNVLRNRMTEDITKIQEVILPKSAQESWTYYYLPRLKKKLYCGYTQLVDEPPSDPVSATYYAYLCEVKGRFLNTESIHAASLL